METLGNIFLGGMEGKMMGMRDGKCRGERNLACFPASPERPGRSLPESGCTGRDERGMVCPGLPPNHVPGVK